VKLRLDVHVPPAVAKALAGRCPGLDVVHLRDWRARAYLRAEDRDILRAAADEARTLFTYDLKTIPPLLRALAETEEDHAGVIFADDRSIPSHDVGALVAALAALWKAFDHDDWTSRAHFLQRARR
jgi:uncharacterized protein DUF5615